MGVVWTFFLIYHFSPLSPSLWETARYRLKNCLKGPLNPKQPTNQKLPVPGRPTIWITVGEGPTALAVGAGGVVWTFLLSSILSFLFSLSVWETARYRLKYCPKGPLNPKPTNQPRGQWFESCVCCYLFLFISLFLLVSIFHSIYLLLLL